MNIPAMRSVIHAIPGQKKKCQRFFILIKLSDALLALPWNLWAVLADRIHPRHSVAVSGCASDDSSDFSRFVKIKCVQHLYSISFLEATTISGNADCLVL